jgi:prepilin-type processing-associated H-X9-DG protein
MDVYRAKLTGDYREVLTSGGTSGTTPGSGTVNFTSYALNLYVLRNTSWAGNPMDGDNKGWHIDRLPAHFPLIADARTYTWTAMTCHSGRGYNIGYADGSAGWKDVGSLVGTGMGYGLASDLGPSYAQYWAGVRTMPLDPRDDPGVLGVWLMQTSIYNRHQVQGDRYGLLWYVFWLMRA